MARYFFDFHQAGKCDSDLAGLELADFEQAYLEAFKAAQDMWSELLKQRRDPRLCSFNVRNEAGETLLVFPFQEVMDSCIDRPRVRPGHVAREAAQTRANADRVRKEMWQILQMARRTRDETRRLLEQIPD